jgi:aminoglycoside phosphotransferase (APT) family kinase protein
MTARMHDDEIELDEDLVARLLATLSPAHDGLPLRRFASSGSTNALFRLGDDLLVRVPRQPGGTSTIEKEQRWLPYVAPHLPVATPEVVAVGDPGFGYPEKWSVVRYLDGDQPALPEPDQPPRHDLARDLAGVVAALGGLSVPDAARKDPTLQWYRGRPLATMDDDMQGFLRDSSVLPDIGLDLDTVAEVWAETMSMPEVGREVPAAWYHGDLNAENLLVRDGRLVAVLDFGGLSVGAPTNDLAVAWQLLDPAARATFRDTLGVDDVTWRLARGWALVLAMMAQPYYWKTMPDRCLRGIHTAKAVLADARADAG